MDELDDCEFELRVASCERRDESSVFEDKRIRRRQVGVEKWLCNEEEAARADLAGEVKRSRLSNSMETRGGRLRENDQVLEKRSIR